MKVLLTGATGILGTDLTKQFELMNFEVQGFNSSGINLGNYSDVWAKVTAFKPDVVVHSAAMTNVDLCEDDRDAAMLVNVIGPQNMAIAAARSGARIVYVSSCGVYGNGKTTPYTELDNTAPVNYHHFTKLEGEKRVKEHHTDHLIIRPGWLFGGTTAHKKNFVEARRKEAANNSLLKSAADKKGSPTYTLDLAKQILLLTEQEMTGTFNVVNEDCATRFDYVKEIVELLGLTTQVEPVNSNEFPRKANMPDNECLANMHLNLRQINVMRNWKDALKDYIHTTYHQ